MSNNWESALDKKVFWENVGRSLSKKIGAVAHWGITNVRASEKNGLYYQPPSGGYHSVNVENGQFMFSQSRYSEKMKTKISDNAEKLVAELFSMISYKPKTASDLRVKLIRLAHAKPELRSQLLPLITKSAKGNPKKGDTLPLKAVLGGKDSYDEKLKDGNHFVVLPIDSKNSDPYMMYLTDKSYKVLKVLGTHPNLKGGKAWLKNNKGKLAAAVNLNLALRDAPYRDDWWDGVSNLVAQSVSRDNGEKIWDVITVVRHNGFTHNWNGVKITLTDNKNGGIDFLVNGKNNGTSRLNDSYTTKKMIKVLEKTYKVLKKLKLASATKSAGGEIVYYSVMNDRSNEIYYFGATKSQKGAIRIAQNKSETLSVAIMDTKKMSDEEITDWCNMRRDLSMHEAQILFTKPNQNDLVIKWVYDDVSSARNAKIVSGANPYFLSRKDKGMWKNFQSWAKSKFN